MTIACPEGVGPGEMMAITLPDGRTMEVAVPEGVAAGQQFQVDVGGVPDPAAEAAASERRPRPPPVPSAIEYRFHTRLHVLPPEVPY